MKRPAFVCDRCGAEHNGNPYTVAVFMRDDVLEEVRTDKLTARQRKIGMMKFCKHCVNEIVGFAMEVDG